jgi:hypothetical protein
MDGPRDFRAGEGRPVGEERAMNDPHVESLLYRIEYANDVDYVKAPPLEHQEPGFNIRIENARAQIDMRDHYAAVQEARAAVEPFLRAWELAAALKFGPAKWGFVYDCANVIDRNPTPGAHHLDIGAALIGISGMGVNLHVSRASYPPPPAGLARDAAVDLMFDRYCMYCEGRTTLPDAANYCLTVLELSAGSRKAARIAASRRFAVALPVLKKLGELAASKGGKEARKADAAHAEFTPTERDWLTKVIPVIIQRAAEVAFDPNASRPQITMTDLPALAPLISAR